MRIPLIPAIIMAVICIAIDCYIYLAAKRRCDSPSASKLQLCSALLLYIVIGVTLCLPRDSCTDSMLQTVMWILFAFVSIYASKLVFVIVDLIAKIPVFFGHSRIKFLSLAGGVLAMLTFLVIWWGALINRFRMQVNEVVIEVSNLPASFDGYRIAQISDLHTGSYFCDTTFVSRLADKVNSLNPDLIVFTGDIVNRHASELKPFVESLSRLYAPDGVVSILGNHDYGDYHDWRSPEKKRANLRELIALQNRMGWNLLLNSSIKIYNNGDSIAVIGVENVGDPPFKVYGSLKDSYPDLSDDVTKILLTHNPAHWSQDVANSSDKNIALTLSGHTHAMQMELLGLSPAVFRYKTWGGLYNDNDGRHPLYVNIGAGTVGLPMRIGATPEITVITLRRAK